MGLLYKGITVINANKFVEMAKDLKISVMIIIQLMETGVVQTVNSKQVGLVLVDHRFQKVTAL